MTEIANVTRREAWLMAARPHTLPAAAAPVVVGTGLAYAMDVLALLPAIAAFVGAALIQIGTNLANDYYDAVQGADTEDRQGFTRVTAGGLIDENTVKRATFATFAAAILVGVYLVYVGGIPILVIGLLSVISGVAYTGGPYPLGYHGLGDLFVFIFFGIIAVAGTFYVQAAHHAAGVFPATPPPGTVPLAAIVASLPVAAIATNILVVNNLRDRDEDKQTGKTTLAVLLGYRGARAEFLALFTLAYATPLWFYLRGGGLFVLLPWLSMPLAGRLTKTILERTDGAALNPALTRTGQLLALYSILFAIGLAL